MLVAGILLLDTITKSIVENRIRAITGMDAKIGKLEVGLATPTITIEGLKLYNKPEFGGSPLLDMPEFHVEYDFEALRSRKIHFKLIRLNISEFSIVRNHKGLVNIKDVDKNGTVRRLSDKTSAGGFEFTGIDTLNLTLGKGNYQDLSTPSSTLNHNFGITNRTFSNLKTAQDFQNMGQELMLSSGLDFSADLVPKHFLKLDSKQIAEFFKDIFSH